MPKRPKTPPIQDDAKYLTVVGPYPAHPNLELEEPRREFARWIASCTGPGYFRSFYHKPSSPGSVIIEIDKKFSKWEGLLGEHKWSEFLKEPKDVGRFVSKVFYCTYNTDRDVQKTGWKRVDVQDKWFKSKASKFVSPYPATYWCDMPRTKDVIQSQLCRPLPRSNFPPPPPEPMPVVGTPEWQAWRQLQHARPSAITAWTSRAEQIQTSPTPSTAATSTLVSRTASSRGSSTPQPIPRQAWQNAITLIAPPGLPPLITRGGSSSRSSQRSKGSAWGGSPAHRSGSPLDAQRSGTASSDDIVPATPAQNGTDPIPLAALSLDDGEEIDYYYSADGDAAPAPEGDPGVIPLYDITALPHAQAVFVRDPAEGSDHDVQEDDVEDDNEDANAANPDLDLCPEHNVVCARGICSIYAAMKREKAREERRQEVEEQRARTQSNKARKQRGRNGLSDTPPSYSPEGTPPPSGVRKPPPHLRAGTPLPSHTPSGSVSRGPPSAGSTRQMPAHLRRGASGSPDHAAPAARDQFIPSPSYRKDDDLRSQSSGGWGDLSEGPWGAPPGSWKPAADKRKGPATQRNAPAAGAWGKAASVTSSAVRRNKDSWSVSSARHEEGEGVEDEDGDDGLPRPTEQGKWGRAASVTSSAVRRNNDSWSVSSRSRGATDARSAVGSDDGNWGRPPSVVGEPRSWADEVDEEYEANAADVGTSDVRSVAASEASGWGNISEGPW